MRWMPEGDKEDCRLLFIAKEHNYAGGSIPFKHISPSTLIEDTQNTLQLCDLPKRIAEGDDGYLW